MAGYLGRKEAGRQAGLASPFSVWFQWVFFLGVKSVMAFYFHVITEREKSRKDYLKWFTVVWLSLLLLSMKDEVYVIGFKQRALLKRASSCVCKLIKRVSRIGSLSSGL